MFTLQILDRGQTFLHAIDGAPLVLGKGEEANVRLAEAGVQRVHARLEPGAEGVRLVAVGPVFVNGQAVQSTLLALGDRIEIGKAVLVVGRSVTRTAGPDDVLAEALPRARANRGRPDRKTRWVPIAAAGLVLAVVAAVALQGDDASRVNGEFATIARLRQSGQVEQASAAIERLQRSWAGAADDRLRRLESERDALLAIDATTVQLTDQVLDPALARTYAEWNRELQRLEVEGSAAEQVAARRVRSSLRDTLIRRPTVSVPTAPAVAAANEPVHATTAPIPDGVQGTRPVAIAPQVVASQPSATAPAPDRSSAEQAFTEAERLVDQGLFTQALALLQAELANVDGALTFAAVQRRIDKVRTAAQQALAAVFEEAARSVAAGKPSEATAVLSAARHRFPATAEFETLATELTKAEALAAAAARATPATRPGAVDPAVRTATLASLRSQMEQVRSAEERAAFGEAASLLQQAAVLVRDRDVDFARRLEVRAAEAGLLAEWHDSIVRSLQAGRSLMTTSAAGQGVELQSADGASLVGSSVGGEVRLSWHEIGAAGLIALAEQSQPTGKALLGITTLLYKQGENEPAEVLLAKALRGDASQKASIDEVIARGRGEPLDALGYVLGKDGFVSGRSIEVQKQAQKLAGRLDTVLRDKNPAVRDAFVTDVLASGPDALAVMVAAFQKEFARQVQKLESGNLKKQLDRLAQQRVMLDGARTF
ncbi:MAG: FHA domain-containing protein, partial [Planctomycetota bacterium]